MIRKRMRNWAMLAAGGTVLASVLVALPISAQALSGSQFNPGYIISDPVFFNKNAMTEAQIQSFIVGMLPATCAQANGMPCLKNFTQTTGSRVASPGGNCLAYTGAANEPASRIIYKVAQACGINPQVILATLQKEEALVTLQSPTVGRYRAAMGYGCPDTSAGCDANYYGFYNQVYKAAWQFKQYAIHPLNWNHHIGNVAIRFSPNAACGTSVVYIQNQATADLYNYTPYQPNGAALANLGGTGDGCSSYGNRNFWVYFNTWFGSSSRGPNPIGVIDSVVAGPGAITATGWAFDPDVVDPINVTVAVDNVPVTVLANVVRPNLPLNFPGYGTTHGYAYSIPATGGVHSVCVTAVNTGVGANVALGCRTVTVPSGSPIGVIDSVVAAPGSITATGWTFDRDTADPISVTISVDSVPVTLVANVVRPNLPLNFPGYGTTHGYAYTIAESPGAHVVCVTALNVGVGSDLALGCRTVTVPSGSPIGVIDSVVTAPNSITATGWAFDRDTVNPISVTISVDAVPVTIVASVVRPNLPLNFPGYGTTHGYVYTIAATTGAHTVCVTALNVGVGTDLAIGCRIVVVPG